jgi:hypothetical protein
MLAEATAGGEGVAGAPEPQTPRLPQLPRHLHHPWLSSVLPTQPPATPPNNRGAAAAAGGVVAALGVALPANPAPKPPAAINLDID